MKTRVSTPNGAFVLTGADTSSGGHGLGSWARRVGVDEAYETGPARHPVLDTPIHTGRMHTHQDLVVAMASFAIQVIL